MRLTLNLIFSLIVLASAAQVSVRDLKTENRNNPIGLEETRPRFSWKISSPQRNTMQTAFEIRVGYNPTNLLKGHVWNSGKIMSSQSHLVSYDGKPLIS